MNIRAAAVVAGAADQGLVWPVPIEREGADGNGFSAVFVSLLRTRRAQRFAIARTFFIDRKYDVYKILFYKM